MSRTPRSSSRTTRPGAPGEIQLSSVRRQSTGRTPRCGPRTPVGRPGPIRPRAAPGVRAASFKGSRDTRAPCRRSRGGSAHPLQRVAIARRRGGSASSTAAPTGHRHDGASGCGSAERPEPRSPVQREHRGGMPIARLTSEAMDRAWTYSRRRIQGIERQQPLA